MGAGRPKAPWQRIRRVQAQKRITEAAVELQSRGEQLTLSALARQSGYDRATITRHFRDPENALVLAWPAPTGTAALLAERMETRPATEPSGCMALHALIDVTQAVCATDEGLEFAKGRADLLWTSAEALLSAAAYYLEHHHQDYARLLARRHGRAEPGAEDLLAADLLFVTSVRWLERWRQTGFDEDVIEVGLEVLRSLGHTLDGDCLLV